MLQSFRSLALFRRSDMTVYGKTARSDRTRDRISLAFVPAKRVAWSYQFGNTSKKEDSNETQKI